MIKHAKSVVYFVQIGEHIKVGWTRSLQDRLPQLGRGARLLAYFPGNQRTEGQIHRELEYAHVRGELFDAYAVKAYLRELGFELVPNAVFELSAKRKRRQNVNSFHNPYSGKTIDRPKRFSMWDYVNERNKIVR